MRITLTDIADEFGMSENDMKKVLIAAGYISKDGSDFSDDMYEQGIVSDNGKIVKPKKLKRMLYGYKSRINWFLKSRTSGNDDSFSTIKVLLRDKIKENSALYKFSKSGE